MSGAIAIFVKTPGLSPVKTRLATGIGTAAAERWYLAAAHVVAEAATTAATAQQSVVYWAVAEAEPHALTQWPLLQVLMQGMGTLGARMAAVHRALVERHGFALLLGADTPQLDDTEMGAVLQWLSAPAPRAAIGPATDGGFWMFGSNRVVAESLWTSLAYSHADTCKNFQQALVNCGFEWRVSNVLTDVDKATDLLPCATQIDCLPSASAAQQALAALSRQLAAGVDPSMAAS